jgi:hypothetical protein
MPTTWPFSTRVLNGQVVGICSREQGHGSFLSVINSVGSLWTVATTNSQSDDEQFSFMACFSNNFDQFDGLFNDTIKEICHKIHAYTTSNESFTYLQMLQQEDFKQFF